MVKNCQVRLCHPWVLGFSLFSHSEKSPFFPMVAVAAMVENPVSEYVVIPWNDHVEPLVHPEKHKVPRSRVSDPAVEMEAAKEEVDLIDTVDVVV